MEDSLPGTSHRGGDVVATQAEDAKFRIMPCFTFARDVRMHCVNTKQELKGVNYSYSTPYSVL